MAEVSGFSMAYFAEVLIKEECPDEELEDDAPRNRLDQDFSEEFRNENVVYLPGMPQNIKRELSDSEEEFLGNEPLKVEENPLKEDFPSEALPANDKTDNPEPKAENAVKKEEILPSSSAGPAEAGTANQEPRFLRKEKLTCEICQESFKLKARYDAHMLKHTAKLNCGFCSAVLSTRKLLNEHRKTHKGELMFKCEFCGKECGSRASLTAHRAIHNGNDYECEICQKKFNQARKVRRHMLLHSEDKPFDCDVCGMKFRNHSGLSFHVRIHTGEDLHECDICHKKFNRVSNLKEHLLIHTDLKRYSCELCGTKFRQKSNLHGHMKIHTNDKPFACQICGLRFEFQSRLQKHAIVVHSGEKPFACDVCGQKFGTKANLNRHAQTHTGIKHECSFCEKKFNQPYDLKTHMLIHTTDVSYDCDICGASFDFRARFQKHMRRHGVQLAASE